MAAKLLTDLTIAKVRPDPQKRIEIPDRQQPGLYLVVQPSGKRGFAVRTRLAGKPIKVTIGQVGVIDLATPVAGRARRCRLPYGARTRASRGRRQHHHRGRRRRRVHHALRQAAAPLLARCGPPPK